MSEDPSRYDRVPRERATVSARGVATLYPSNVAELTHGLSQRVRASSGAYQRTGKAMWGFAIVMIILAGLMPYLGSQNQVLLTQQALYLGLLALSLNLLVNTTGLISFGHAMFMGFGAYMVAVPVKHLDWSPLIGVALAPLLGAFAAFVIGFIVLRGKELYFALLTLGVGQLVWAVAHGTQSLTGGSNGITGIFGAEWMNAFQHPFNLYWFIFGVTLGATVLLYIITRSPFGDALRGIRENRRRAEFAGISIKRYEMMAFVVAGTFGAIAGALFVIGETNIVSTQIAWQKSAQALIVVLLGGVRYFLGPFAGAIFWIFVFDYVIERTTLWDIVFGVIVLIVALFLTGGLVGVFHWLFAKAVDIWDSRRGIELEVEPEVVPGVADASEVAALASVAGAGDGDAAAVVTAAVKNGKPVLHMQDVSKRFGGLVAVDDVTLTVRQGEFHAIIGPNGAGKTTLFNVITGTMKPDGGEIALEGEDITGTASWRLVKRGVGRSFQQTNLFWNLDATTNITVSESASKDITYRIWGSQPEAIRERASNLLRLVGLQDSSHTAAIELSHGDQRALEIAAALAVESRLLLLDEPTAGLSPAETRDAIGLIKRIAGDHELTVLFVEHDMDVVFGIADRITVLHRGAVLAEGTPQEIRANPEVRAAYLGEDDDGGTPTTGDGAGSTATVTKDTD